MDQIQVPPSRYEAAIRSYNSVSDWLGRPESTLKELRIDVYAQGSFRLGTAVRPLGDHETYDLDVICEFYIAKNEVTQEELQDMLGVELEDYARARSLREPSRWPRCWTLNYSDEAQFNMDLVPALPDGERQVILLKEASLRYDFANTAILITDSGHRHFRTKTDDWDISNPRGYADWFVRQMQPRVEKRKLAERIDAGVHVETVPEYRRRTPLQKAIQLLKKHRDVRFEEEPSKKPSSIILTTLATAAYGGETTLVQTIKGILASADGRIQRRGSTTWIPNPADPRENLADSWAEDPALEEAFRDWVKTAAVDFRRAEEAASDDERIDAMAPRIGRTIAEGAARRVAGSTAKALARRASTEMATVLQDAPHRRPPPWKQHLVGAAWIDSATCRRSGFRPHNFRSNGAILPKGATLTFQAKTNISKPYRVYWQVVNVGAEARAEDGLRGQIEAERELYRGHLKTTESTLYHGSHSIECFIVKDEVMVARSGQFVVSIGRR